MAGIKHGAGFDQLRQTLEGLDRAQCRVGFFGSSKYADGTPVAYVAAIQEFGSPSTGTPPRPYMRPTVASRRTAWIEVVRRASRDAIVNTQDGGQVLEILGQVASGDVAKSIKNLTAPALSPVTVLLRQWRRGGVEVTRSTVALAARLIAQGAASPAMGGTFAKPLVDSGILFNAVSYEVDK